MTTPHPHGSCLCGAVRFTAALPVKWVAHCHCTYCRRAHGAPFVTWAGFPTGQFSLDLTSTQPTWYESSPGAKRGFCPRCGKPDVLRVDALARRDACREGADPGRAGQGAGGACVL